MEKLIRGKRGLSEVLATLMIILLVLIAIGIIWLVVRSVVQGGADEIEISQKCLNVELEAVSVKVVAGDYDVTVRRGGDSEGALTGLYIAVLGNGVNSGVTLVAVLESLETATYTITDTGAGADHVEITASFEDRSGNEVFCKHTTTFYF